MQVGIFQKINSLCCTFIRYSRVLSLEFFTFCTHSFCSKNYTYKSQSLYSPKLYLSSIFVMKMKRIKPFLTIYHCKTLKNCYNLQTNFNSTLFYRISGYCSYQSKAYDLFNSARSKKFKINHENWQFKNELYQKKKNHIFPLSHTTIFNPTKLRLLWFNNLRV